MISLNNLAYGAMIRQRAAEQKEVSALHRIYIPADRYSGSGWLQRVNGNGGAEDCGLRFTLDEKVKCSERSGAKAKALWWARQSQNTPNRTPGTVDLQGAAQSK